MDLEPDVEIVLVHGIGRQQQGATLAGFANRFGRSLRARFGAESVTQSATHLRSVPVASTTFALKSPQHDLDHVVRIREAFWAESFHPPKTGAVLRWALVLAPLAVAARGVHLVQYSVWRWWDHPLHWWRIVLAGAFALASWPL